MIKKIIKEKKERKKERKKKKLFVFLFRQVSSEFQTNFK